MPRPDKFYSLTRPKLRQSWNKYNLYNMYKMAGKDLPLQFAKTFFQQKWAAKSRTRSYHGEHIKEKKWQRMFSRRLLSAVDMSPEYLAAHDGSEQAAGRGSGLSTTTVSADAYARVAPLSKSDRLGRQPNSRINDPNTRLASTIKNMTPYMHMTYAPLERRLDTAVYRAMFASSVRQARQFVVHGGVKVNGKKMVHPAYLLNPGDMFQVEIEKVLYGTGAQKARSGRPVQQSIAAREKRDEALVKEVLSRKTTGAEEKAVDGEEAEAESETVEEAEADGAAADGAESLTPAEQWQVNNRQLKFLLKDVKKVLSLEGRDLSAKDKKRLRLFRTSASRFLSQGENAHDKTHAGITELISDLQLQMKSHEAMRDTFQKFNLAEGVEPAEDAGETAPKYNRSAQIEKGFEELNEEQKEKALRIMGDSRLSNDEMRKLASLLKYDSENPVDDSKPYATPWRPRPYMPAFAFVPRYLEVNPRVCAAVYLRHPVARKGIAEVPTPFTYLTSQLAHNWYLRRG